MRQHLQQSGAVSHKHARKDYGCPLRIYDSGSGHFVILPPRSGRAWARYRNHDGSWTGLCGNVSALFHTTRKGVDYFGQRIAWAELPPAVQAALRASFLGEYCPKEEA